MTTLGDELRLDSAPVTLTDEITVKEPGGRSAFDPIEKRGGSVIMGS